ncbi:MAG: hypothetical protein V8S77_08260 [Oscillospiraceae bacterium]
MWTGNLLPVTLGEFFGGCLVGCVVYWAVYLRKERWTMSILEDIRAFVPGCEQEQRDREAILEFLAAHEDAFLRQNLTAHMTASAWAPAPGPAAGGDGVPQSVPLVVVDRRSRRRRPLICWWWPCGR